PLFAAAFATQDAHQTLMVGLAAAVGAGVSMGLAEAFSDDGEISGGGRPGGRGGGCGLVAVGGGGGGAVAFLVRDFGVGAGVAGGISRGLTEALSDDGKISGRGSPWVRGVVCGLMTVVGGVGHALPYLIRDFGVATGLAVLVVLAELVAIAWIRWKYME